jgi:O-succinylbenzoate synthase
MLDSILDSLKVVALPTKTDFRSVKVREVALIEGPQGWGEFSPFLEYEPLECVPWFVSAIEAATVTLPGTLPEMLREKIEVNATMPAVNGDENIAEVLSWFPGCTTVKIKVGTDLREDLARIAIVSNLFTSAKIRIDVNGSWSVGKATQAIHAINDICNLEYVEQPCNSLEDLRELKKRVGISVLIAGDEVVRKATDPMSMDLHDAIDVLLLKVAPLGGIKKSLEIATHHGKPVVVSSALESAVGISYGLHLAATLPTLTYACGLATGQLLVADVATLPIIDGLMSVAAVTPEPIQLEKYSVLPQRMDWWRTRVRETWNAGAKAWVLREGWEW